MRLVLPLLVLLMAAPAWAGDARRAGELQQQAKDALDDGDAEEALRLAQRAISIEAGPSTWLAQQIRIEILEGSGAYTEALRHLRSYMDIDGLFPEHRAWGKETRNRLRAEQERIERMAAGRRGAGIAMVGVGAVPLVLGIASLANYGDKTSGNVDPAPYEGYLDAGVAALVVGGVLEGVGIALLASSASPSGMALAPTPWMIADKDAVVFGLAGRF
jgi:hypothetical protein